jgi:hypothetical protein
MRREVDRRTFLKIGGAATGAVAGVTGCGDFTDDSLLMGIWSYLIPIPGAIWKRQVEGGEADLDFMSDDHHRIRDFVVLEVPRVGKPLTPEFIAQRLDLSLDQVVAISEDLEKHMTFLFRNEQGAVSWAYPVTVDETPHQVSFSTGEQIHAA